MEAEGVTWLELFILFHRHGGNLNDDADTLANKNTLQRDLAAFKKMTRDVFNYTCPPEDEWVIKPSNARSNRLRTITIANKHVSIKGMPRVTDEENAQIVKSLIAMRGIHAKKQRQAWDDDNLYAKPAALTLRGGTKWLSSDMKDDKLPNWVTKGVDGEDARNNLHVIKLRHMRCSGCNHQFEVGNLRLTRGAQLSSLTCT